MKKRNWKAALILGILLVAFCIPVLKSSHVQSPPYLGRTLTYWAGQHPSKYYEAVVALGTNAVPYLLAELQAQDALLPKVAQKALGSVISIGEIFIHAKHRRYYARLGFQVLDTNGVPALLDLLLAKNQPTRDLDPSFEAAWALSWISSTNAEAMKLSRLMNSLASDDVNEKLAACSGLTFALSAPPPFYVSEAVLLLASHPDTRLRQAAVRYFGDVQNAETIAFPAILKFLSDANDLVRQLAFSALETRKTNADSAIPTLLTLYSNTASDGSLRDHNFRAQIRRAIQQINPAKTPP